MSTRKTSKELTVNDLKTLLRKKNLPTTGKKKDLQDRLEMYNMRKSELQKKAKAKKLPTNGTKAVLVRRIQSGRASPPRCCNQPTKARKSPAKKTKKTTSAKCTLGKNGRNYYFKGNPPHKRITDAKAKRIGSGPCVSSSTRTQSQLNPQDKEAIKNLADNLRKSLATRKSPSSTRTRETRSMYGGVNRASRASNLRRSMRDGGVLKSLNELNPRTSADLRRSRAQVRNDITRQSARGDISLLRVGLEENGTPFFLELLESKFNPEDVVNVYKKYPVRDVDKLATVDSKTADRLRGSGNLDPVPRASLLPNFSR